jgi:hypothetical protein
VALQEPWQSYQVLVVLADRVVRASAEQLVLVVPLSSVRLTACLPV